MIHLINADLRAAKLRSQKINETKTAGNVQDKKSRFNFFLNHAFFSLEYLYSSEQYIFEVELVVVLDKSVPIYLFKRVHCN